MKKYTLVTGASSGIGYELAHICAKKGNNLVLVARNVKKLQSIKQKWERTYSIYIEVIEADLSKADAPIYIYEEVQTKKIFIEQLINNAGVGSFGYFHKNKAKDDLQIVDVNIRALTYLCKLFIPHMVKNRKGRILNVASTAGFAPGPMMSVYYASKAYVISLSYAIAKELKGSGVTVSILCPGPTKTDFQRRSNMKKASFTQGAVMNPRVVAMAGYSGMMKGKRIITPGTGNKVLVEIMKILPYRISTFIVECTQDKK